MTSEVRRAAKSLVERRSETFETTLPPEACRARLARELAALGKPRAVDFAGSWKPADGREHYEASFAPPRGIQWFLRSSSVVMAALIASSAWVIHSRGDDPAIQFLLPLFTVLAVLAFPLVVAMLGSNREAEESRIRRAIRRALGDGQHDFPPPHKWKDED
jgi:hypothetical protein